MTSDPPPYAGFLGIWELIPESCNYEQGDAPHSGTYIISETEEGLRFDMHWTDHKGQPHDASFSGIPNGVPTPYQGGELADALSITAESPRELTSRAFFQGEELMVAQRQLDDTGQAMRVIQVVRLPYGESPANISIYRRLPFEA